MVDVSGETLALLAREIGDRSIAVPADLSDIAECERVVARPFGVWVESTRILVNSAAILARTPLDEADAASFARIFDTIAARCSSFPGRPSETWNRAASAGS